MDPGAVGMQLRGCQHLAPNGGNAWRFVWLRFPGDDYWVRADQYRSRFESLQIKRAASKTAAP